MLVWFDCSIYLLSLRCLGIKYAVKQSKAVK
ncbi:hypothetical protein swp_2852 [Shewanella piezotolerans WP3]|uniref:Uncharacterized protein n=1 Tax=Shewanella piezotolerans (strain WP3 / JCM 13877) TaxID=225849 RepID=B8CPK2_SHEPW|nr:hypothetical protein swp_2852 [Shewanella piezotolerans WP3]